MTKRNPEYDRFGPWVIEITENDPPPPLFVPYLTGSEEPLFSIKIPRKIERRVAKPGMNLYDYMVMLYEDNCVILQRVDSDVLTHTFSYGDIQFIRFSEELLKGTLHLCLLDKSFDLPFNTVSKEIMRRVVGLIRQRYTGDTAPLLVKEEAQIDEEDLSFYFKGLLNEQKMRNPAQLPLASQPNTAVGSFESGPLRKLLFGAISKTLLESLHLSDGRELKIITRGKSYKYKWQTIYGTTTFMIPVNRITGVSWEEDDTNTAVSHLYLETAGGRVGQPLISTNPTVPPYERFLSALPGSSKDADGSTTLEA